jgi:hypothetical protein
LFLRHTKSTPARLLLNVVWQKEKYISNLLDLGENPACCLAKREIYFQFPRAAAGARKVVWQNRNIFLIFIAVWSWQCCLASSVLHLPNKLCKRAAGVDPLTKL